MSRSTYWFSGGFHIASVHFHFCATSVNSWLALFESVQIVNTHLNPTGLVHSANVKFLYLILSIWRR